MNLRNVLSNPKMMALSGLLAMVPKGIIVGILSFSLGLFLSKSDFWEFCFVLYPIVGILLDIVLYCLKNKLWKTLPKPESIPEDWQILPEELLQFAKQLPKVRLMRLVGCLFILPFVSFDKGSVFLVIFSWVTVGYFIFSLFDWVWLSIFKLKRPEFIIKKIISRNDMGELTYAWWKPGTPAWCWKKILDDRLK